MGCSAFVTSSEVFLLTDCVAIVILGLDPKFSIKESLANTGFSFEASHASGNTEMKNKGVWCIVSQSVRRETMD